jgi:hypothetical protein
MTAALQKAFTKAATMPDELQKQLAQQMLEDIEAEQKWDQTLSKSHKTLAQMASNAKEASQQGKTHKKGFDHL